MQRDAEQVERLYKLNLAMGGRKGFLQNKKDYVTLWCLHSEQGFVAVAYGIELRCRYADGTTRYWHGNGAVKRRGAEDSAKFVQELRESGIEIPGGGEADFQIDITEIWDQIAPYLESPNR